MKRGGTILENNPLAADTREVREPQDLSDFGLGPDDVISLLSMFDLYGIWKLDCETGLVYWSRDVYLIHGLEPSNGTVNVRAAVDRYHPEDASIVGQLVEECVEYGRPYRFVLRIKHRDQGYKLVKSTGRSRENSEGKRELIGTFSEFALPVRSIASTG